MTKRSSYRLKATGADKHRVRSGNQRSTEVEPQRSGTPRPRGVSEARGGINKETGESSKGSRG